jgi:tetratricopeptide (TPR) repeat protein
MRLFTTTLVFLSLAVPAAAADRSDVIDRFLARCRENPQLNDAVREQVAQTVEKMRRDPSTAGEAITAGLKLISTEFAAGLQSLGDEQAAQAIERLTPLATSNDPFLAAESAVFIAHALIQQEQHEAALPRLADVIQNRANDTVRTGEAWFLRAKCRAATLDRNAAVADFLRFLNEFPDAAPRMRREAQASLIDIEEANFSLLNDIHDKMDFSRRRLGLEDSGDRTQEVQEEVVALLTEMIEELEKKCGSCKGCKCSGSKPGGGGMGGASPGMSSGTSQEARITERDGPRTPWVDLSQRHEDPTAFNAAKSRFPLQYKDLVEQYYRSFQDNAGK